MTTIVPKRQLDTKDGLKLLLPKEVSSWMDNSAFRRSTLSDYYITSKTTPSGRYVYFIYLYEIVVFSTFRGTKKHFLTALKITSYIPIDDISGYLIQLEDDKLYAREVEFDFEFENIEERSKHFLIDGYSISQDRFSISHLEHSSQLSVVYKTPRSDLNFRTFKIGSWVEACNVIEGFGDHDYTSFPCLHNGRAYAFKKHDSTTIRSLAVEFGRICEANPNVVNTIRADPEVNRLQLRVIELRHDLIHIQLNEDRQNDLYPIRQRRWARERQNDFVHNRNLIQRRHAHRIEDLIDDIQEELIEAQEILVEAEQRLHRHTFDMPIAIRSPQLAARFQTLQQRRHRRPVAHLRIIQLVNDLSCVGIPDEVAEAKNNVDKFEFQWLGQRLYLLWSIGIGRYDLDEPIPDSFYANSDSDIPYNNFINFFAIFDIEALTWYPIKISGLSPFSESPLLFHITTDMFMTLFDSQMSMPFSSALGSLRSSEPELSISILQISAQHSKKARVYRIPMRDPDSLISLAQSLFNRTYPDLTPLNHQQLKQRYGRCIANDDYNFYIKNDADLDNYIYNMKRQDRKQPKSKKSIGHSATSKQP